MTASKSSRRADRTVQSVPRIAIETLLAGGREVILLHGETEYRLRLTSNGKLILTK
jgi:hemin uptake protein HemP